MTVINGADNSTVPPVTVGTQPDAIAINPVTNKIYVANFFNGAGGNSVTVIDGAER